MAYQCVYLSDTDGIPVLGFLSPGTTLALDMI